MRCWSYTWQFKKPRSLIPNFNGPLLVCYTSVQVILQGLKSLVLKASSRFATDFSKINGKTKCKEKGWISNVLLHHEYCNESSLHLKRDLHNLAIARSCIDPPYQPKKLGVFKGGAIKFTSNHIFFHSVSMFLVQQQQLVGVPRRLHWQRRC